MAAKGLLDGMLDEKIDCLVFLSLKCLYLCSNLLIWKI